MSERTGAAERWDVPSVGGSDGGGYLTAGRLEAVQKEAYDEAWTAGFAKGQEAGEQQVRERCSRFDALLRSLERPFDELDEQVEVQLVDLAMTVASQLFRREIALDPTHIVGVVRDAIRALPIASRNIELHLHPEDARLIRELLSPSDCESAWTIVEDPLLAQGGCEVVTENSRIDASAESRMQALIRQIVGDQRT